MKLRVKIGDAEVEASGSKGFVGTVVGKFYCLVAGKHKRGKFLRVDHGSEQYNVYACPRCSRETRYKVKPKSADVLQIPVSRT